MLIKYSDYLSYDDGIDFDDMFTFSRKAESFDYLAFFGEEKKKIILQGRTYPVVSNHVLVRSKGTDGKYHAIYIQIDYKTGEYYIGKVNRKRWKEVDRYPGSGVKFKNKYEKHKESFVRFYLLVCYSEEESEIKEAEIVNEELLKDPFCLNLVKGGGGINKKPQSEDRRARQSQYMKEHPERVKAMLDAVRNLEEEKIKMRNAHIKATMSDDKYKKMTRDRIKNWMQRDPEGVKKAREKNKVSLSNPEIKARRVQKIKEWRQNNPEKAKVWDEKRRASLSNPETKAKQSASRKEWIKNNPDKMAEFAAKSALSRSKPVNMIDIKTGEVIKSFKSCKEAGQWLIDNGYTNSVNPSSGICNACIKKQIPGHGTKRTAYGFKWEYIETDKRIKNIK